eukprot:jgi/Pico_ML_1/51630/g2624.t1
MEPMDPRKRKGYHSEEEDVSKVGVGMTPTVELRKRSRSLGTPQANGTGFGTASRAFQRVKAEEWMGRKGAFDNSYWSKSGAEDGYGAKAEQVLGQVKGRDFRHEKNKKKRSTYRGGLIETAAVHSIKFASSDEEL